MDLFCGNHWHRTRSECLIGLVLNADDNDNDCWMARCTDPYDTAANAAPATLREFPRPSYPIMSRMHDVSARRDRALAHGLPPVGRTAIRLQLSMFR